MPYISTKKNKQIFNLKSKTDSVFEPDNYKVIKLYDLDMNKIESLDQYSNIPGTILYNPWSTTFYFYTNGMDLKAREADPQVSYNSVIYTNSSYEFAPFSTNIPCNGIPRYNFNNFTESEVSLFFKKNYNKLVDHVWNRYKSTTKGLIGVEYHGPNYAHTYALGDNSYCIKNCLNLSIDFVSSSVKLVESNYKQISSGQYKYYFFHFLNYIKKILLFEHMKTNRSFSDLLSILPPEGILQGSSRTLFLGMNTDEINSLFNSIIQDPRFIDQIEIINQSNLSEFSFQDFSARLISKSHSIKFFNSLDLSSAFSSSSSRVPDSTILDSNPWIPQTSWFDIQHTAGYAGDRNLKSLIEDFDPNPIIYWQPARFDVISRWNNYRSLNADFAYRDPKYDLPFLYLNSSAHPALQGKSCSVLLIPENPSETININPVSHHYS